MKNRQEKSNEAAWQALADSIAAMRTPETADSPGPAARGRMAAAPVSQVPSTRAPVQGTETARANPVPVHTIAAKPPDTAAAPVREAEVIQARFGRQPETRPADPAAGQPVAGPDVAGVAPADPEKPVSPAGPPHPPASGSAPTGGSAAAAFDAMSRTDLITHLRSALSTDGDAAAPGGARVPTPPDSQGYTSAPHPSGPHLSAPHPSGPHPSGPGRARPARTPRSGDRVAGTRMAGTRMAAAPGDTAAPATMPPPGHPPPHHPPLHHPSARPEAGPPHDPGRRQIPLSAGMLHDDVPEFLKGGDSARAATGAPARPEPQASRPATLYPGGGSTRQAKPGRGSGRAGGGGRLLLPVLLLLLGIGAAWVIFQPGSDDLFNQASRAASDGVRQTAGAIRSVIPESADESESRSFVLLPQGQQPELSLPSEDPATGQAGRDDAPPRPAGSLPSGGTRLAPVPGSDNPLLEALNATAGPPLLAPQADSAQRPAAATDIVDPAAGPDRVEAIAAAPTPVPAGGTTVSGTRLGQPGPDQTAALQWQAPPDGANPDGVNPGGANADSANPGEPKPETTGALWRVQLAALADAAGARAEAQRLQNSYPGLLAGHAMTVERADLERGTFFRLKAGGFPTAGGAQALCESLRTRGQDCLVVR